MAPGVQYLCYICITYFTISVITPQLERVCERLQCSLSIVIQQNILDTKPLNTRHWRISFYILNILSSHFFFWWDQILFFNWRKIALQCCAISVVPHCESSISTHISPPLFFPPPCPHPPPSFHPSRSPQSWAPVLYSSFPLVIYKSHQPITFTHSSVYMSKLFSPSVPLSPPIVS